MRNRAKCKKCDSIIESFHTQDLVYCKCGEIAVDKGQAMKCIAGDWANFVRVDDEGNEIVPKVISKDALETATTPVTIGDHPLKSYPTRSELLKMLDDMIASVENLPPAAMSAPITHYDYCSLLILLSAVFRAHERESN